MRRLIALAACGVLGAAVAEPGRAGERPPLGCNDPVVLRMVGAGLHFRGSVPEGYRPTESGLRNPDTGEELRIEVEDGRSGNAVLRIEDTRIQLENIRTAEETDDERVCSAGFVLRRGDRVLRGDADYTIHVSGLDFRVSGAFTIEGTQVRF